MGRDKNIIHVVGTGTIGEPLIGLFTDFADHWEIDEATFHKRTPKANDRANDVSDTASFISAPEAGKHDDPEFGTHHARDADHLFSTIGKKYDLFSSAIKISTQYMHTLWFDLGLGFDTTLEEVKARLRSNGRIAITNKRAVNQIFSFGRDHGYYGRILSQTVVPVPTIAVPNPRKVVGFCYTPQDGNSLLSSVAATLHLIDPDNLIERLMVLRS